LRRHFISRLANHDSERASAYTTTVTLTHLIDHDLKGARQLYHNRDSEQATAVTSPHKQQLRACAAARLFYSKIGNITRAREASIW
jgi:hypothetical protein